MFGNLFNTAKNTDGQVTSPVGSPPQPSQPLAPVAPAIPDPIATSSQATASPVAPIITPSQPPSQPEPPITPPEPPVTPIVVEPTQTSVPPSTPAPEPQTVLEPTTHSPTADPVKQEELSALSHLDSRATQVIAYAQQETVRTHQSLIMPEHLLLGLLQDSEIVKLLGNFSVDTTKLTSELQSRETSQSFTGQSKLSEEVKQIFEVAFQSAKERNSAFISPEDILLSMFSSSIAPSLQAEGVKKEDVIAKLSKSAAYTEGRNSVLEKFGIDLTAKAAAGELDPVAGRDNEIDRLEHILLRRTKNNPIIIGEAGVGKTAIVEGLAQAIVSGKVPDELKNKKIMQIDVSSLVAGASHRGEFEERLRSVMRDVMSSSGQIILFIDEIHTLIGTGDNEGGLDASNIIKPYLSRGQLQILGTTTTSEYRKYFEKDKAFARRFQPLVAEEPTEETAIKMLQVLKTKYENYHHVTIPDAALEAAVMLSKKYIGERYLPDKAVDLLDEAAADVKLQHSAGKREDVAVQRSDIEKVVSSWTGIPITKLTEDESQKLLELEKRIHQRLIDQNGAVSAVSEAVRRGRIGLAAANRPIASFIFLGPTGTGKTELAKTLAEILFGRDDAMVRLDMSEYMEKHEVAKLIGAPPGYVGYEEGGQLTEAVRAKPYSIVLLDEIEKAHPDVFNILLQLLEDGRLTDNKGNTISFKNTIVIATSNIGSQDIQEQLSKPTQTPEEFKKVYTEMQTKISEDLHKFFRPELLNRFDEIVMFCPLRQEDMKYIAKIGIEKTGKLLGEQGISTQITDAALNVLAKEGYDQQYGARPLRRLIQTAIENPIAMMLIQKKFATGDTIQIDYNQQTSAFTFVKLPVVSGQAANGELKMANGEKQEEKKGDVQPIVAPVASAPVAVASQSMPLSEKIMPTTADIAAIASQPVSDTQESSQKAIDEALAQAQSQQISPQSAITQIASSTEIPVDAVTMENATAQTQRVDQISAPSTTFAPPAVAAAGLMLDEQVKSEVA